MASEAHTRETGILGSLIDSNEAAGDVERRGALTISRNHAARVLVYNYAAETKDRHDLAAIPRARTPRPMSGPLPTQTGRAPLAQLVEQGTF